MNDDDVRFEKIEQQLVELQEIAEENNILLLSLRRDARIAFWIRAILWALVIILPFLFIGPIIQSFIPAGAQGAGGGTFGLPSMEQLQELKNLYGGGELPPQ